MLLRDTTRRGETLPRWRRRTPIIKVTPLLPGRLSPSSPSTTTTSGSPLRSLCGSSWPCWWNLVSDSNYRGISWLLINAPTPLQRGLGYDWLKGAGCLDLNCTLWPFLVGLQFSCVQISFWTFGKWFKLIYIATEKRKKLNTKPEQLWLRQIISEGVQLKAASCWVSTDQLDRH